MSAVKISTKGLSGIGDYMSLYRKASKQPLETGRALRVALLSSFTVSGLKETLFLKCAEAGIAADIHVGAYGQHNQEILDPQSALYRFKPDVVILFLDAQTLLGDLYLDPYSVDAAARLARAAEKGAEVLNLVAQLEKRCAAKVVLHDLVVPLHSPLGPLEDKDEFGLHELVRALNTALRLAAKKDSRLFIFDYDAFCARLGKTRVADPKMYYLGDFKLDLQHMAELSVAYLSFLKPLAGLSRKCAVLDLDNTLWGGILGEDGVAGLQLGPTPEGKPFVDFQRQLLALHRRGVLLAINSKNNADEAMKTIREHPYMILREEHFAAILINWDDKASNMKALANQLNIGLESLVFFDDDQMNRALIKETLPEVLVVDLPEDKALYPQTLAQLDDFNTLSLTAEDVNKGKMYAEQKQRAELKLSAADLDDYLEGLQMTATFSKADDFSIPRLAQLTQKTNQFNMTTRRYQEEAVRLLAKNPDYLVFGVKVEDRFGDNGLTGLAIVEKSAPRWRIDTFLMSCRIIGRRVEDAILSYIVAEARKGKATGLRGEFIPTTKNEPAKDFFRRSGFTPLNASGDLELWDYDLARDFSPPAFIRIAHAD